MKVAVIGSGPAGFFVAEEVLKRCPGCEVHMLEKRFAPYGLVRYGVAPDHPLTRRVTKMFDAIGGHPRFFYYGGVEVGRHVKLDELYASFTAVVFCTGAENPNRPVVPGGRLDGTVDALDLARWANGEPTAFRESLLDGVETVAVIGNGNVAIDAARLFARSTVDWVGTDIAPYAMEALAHHRVRQIVIAGRRGAGDVSFTEAEWAELVGLPGWDVREEESTPFGAAPVKPSSTHHLEFRYHLSVACLLGSTRVVGARFTRASSGETVEIPAQLVVFATGHRGFEMAGLPFDATRGVIPNDRGRVSGMPAYYVCGWIKRGAKGLIGQNRKDAIETVKQMLEDRDALAAREVNHVDWTKVLRSRGHRVISWADWIKISAMEQQRGNAFGRSRMNFTDTEIAARPTD
jgi:ferredoxin--NADP+ reductase